MTNSQEVPGGRAELNSLEHGGENGQGTAVNLLELASIKSPTGPTRIESGLTAPGNANGEEGLLEQVLLSSAHETLRGTIQANVKDGRLAAEMTDAMTHLEERERVAPASIARLYTAVNDVLLGKGGNLIPQDRVQTAYDMLRQAAYAPIAAPRRFGPP